MEKVKNTLKRAYSPTLVWSMGVEFPLPQCLYNRLWSNRTWEKECFFKRCRDHLKVLRSSSGPVLSLCSGPEARSLKVGKLSSVHKRLKWDSRGNHIQNNTDRNCKKDKNFLLSTIKYFNTEVEIPSLRIAINEELYKGRSEEKKSTFAMNGDKGKAARR